MLILIFIALFFNELNMLKTCAFAQKKRLFRPVFVEKDA